MTQTLEFPAPAELINANQRLHWAKKAARTKAWREAAHWQAKAARLRPLEHALITIRFSFTDRRKRDCHNLYPTGKALIDGLIDHGLLPDDNDDYLTGPFLHPGPLSADGRVWVRVEIEEA